MKYLIIILTTVILPFTLYSQVGINTKSPSGILDIRISEGSNKEGLTVTPDGKMIIGRSLSSSTDAKLIVEGSLRIETGNEGADKYYTYDKNGNLDWQTFTLGSNIAKWGLVQTSTTAFTFTTAPQQPLSGPSILSFSNIPGIKAVTNGVQVPPGKYLIFLDGDINANELGILTLYDKNTNTNIYSAGYFNSLSPTATYIELSVQSTLGFKFTGYGYKKQSGASGYALPRTTSFFFYCSFLQLS